MKKNVKVRLSPEAEEVYNYLKKEFEEVVTSGRKRTPEAQIFERFEQKKELIKQDVHYGEPIAKGKFLMNTKINTVLRIYFGWNFHIFGECYIL